jgi:hypothetical protein
MEPGSHDLSAQMSKIAILCLSVVNQHAQPPPSTLGTSTMSSGAPHSPAVAPSSGLPYGYVPAYLPGSASLVEQLDQMILIVLRDGRHLVGVRRVILMANHASARVSYFY